MLCVIHKYMKQLRLPTTPRSISLTIIAVLLLGILGYGVYRWRATRIDFTYFEPSSLPASGTLAQRRLIKDERNNGTFIRTTQNFRAKDGWYYGITQWPGRHASAGGGLTKDPRIASCRWVETPHKQTYRLCYHHADEMLTTHVELNRGTTYLELYFPRRIEQADITTMIDSLKPASTLWLPVIHPSSED